MDRWMVRRRGRSLTVDVQPDALANHEEDAIVEAVESEAAGDDFDVVHVTGPMLLEPPRGTTHLIRRIGDTAHRYGKRLDVGPI